MKNSWGLFYKLAGVSSLVSAGLIPLAAYFFIKYPPPGFDPTTENTIGWFNLFADNWLAGLFNWDLVMAIDNILVIPVFIALYRILRKTNEAFITLALIIGFVGIASYFAVNPAFSMLSLSRQYSSASGIDKTTSVAAGQTMLALYQGTGFVSYMFLVSLAGAIIATVMLQTKIFSKVTAYSGILGNVLAPLLFLPVVGLYIGFLSLIPLILWYILVGLKIFKLGKTH
jgi:hypothetical protein